MSSSSSDFSIGHKLGDQDRYRLDKRLGSGAVGDVFLAMDIRLGREVAIKVLKTRWSNDPELRARFHREIELMAALKSEHIIQILDYGITSFGNYFYVMEYLKGRTLSSLMSQVSSIPLERVLDLGVQICAGLKVAHEGVSLWRDDATESETIKVVHRDLKPANIFLINIGIGQLVKILDFGIAKKLHMESGEKTDLTRAFLGTFHYAAPEQLSTHKDLDERADIYSLGMILYEMLCGSDPFGIKFSEHKTSEVTWAMAHSSKEPIPLLTQPNCQNLPPELGDCVMRCLCKNPSSRFNSVSEISQLLKVIKQLLAMQRDVPDRTYPPNISNGNEAPTNVKPVGAMGDVTVIRPISEQYVKNPAIQPPSIPSNSIPYPEDEGIEEAFMPDDEPQVSLPALTRFGDLDDDDSLSPADQPEVSSQVHLDSSLISEPEETIFQAKLDSIRSNRDEDGELDSSKQNTLDSDAVTFSPSEEIVLPVGEEPVIPVLDPLDRTIFQPRNAQHLSSHDSSQEVSEQTMNQAAQVSNVPIDDGTIFQQKTVEKPSGDQTIFQAQSQPLPRRNEAVKNEPPQAVPDSQNLDQTIFQTLPRSGYAPPDAKLFQSKKTSHKQSVQKQSVQPSHSHQQNPNSFGLKQAIQGSSKDKVHTPMPNSLSQTGANLGQAQSLIVRAAAALNIRLPAIFLFSPSSWISRLRAIPAKYSNLSPQFGSNIFSLVIGLVIGVLILGIIFMLNLRFQKQRNRSISSQQTGSVILLAPDETVVRSD